MTTPKNRDFSFDLLRAIAIIGVIGIHVIHIENSSELFSASNVTKIIIKQIIVFSVPLFLFISGIFMVNSKLTNIPDYFRYLKKRLPRVLLPFIIWGILYVLYFYLTTNSQIISLFKSFISFRIVDPFYFVFLIMQYYVLQPIIRFLAKYKITALLAILTSLFMAFLLEILRYKYNLSLPLIIYGGNFLTWLMFPVLGAYVKLNGFNIRQNVLFLATIFFLSLSLFHSYVAIAIYNSLETALTAIKTSSFLYSMFIILYLYSIRDKFRYSRYFVKIGEYSFGIFFSHMFFIFWIVALYKLIAINNYNFFVQLFTLSIVIFCTYQLGKLLHSKLFPSEMATKWFGY